MPISMSECEQRSNASGAERYKETPVNTEQKPKKDAIGSNVVLVCVCMVLRKLTTFVRQLRDYLHVTRSTIERRHTNLESRNDKQLIYTSRATLN